MMKKRILSGKGSVIKNEKIPTLKKPGNIGTPVGPKPKRTSVGEPAVKRGVRRDERVLPKRPAQPGVKRKSPSLGGMLTPKKTPRPVGPRPVRVLPKRVNGPIRRNIKEALVRRKMM